MQNRLENRGLLKSVWKVTESGREAKFYELPPQGRTQLEAETASWERLAAAIALILKWSDEVVR